MKTKILILFIFAFQIGHSQFIFGEDKVIIKSMTERWELDDEVKNGTFKLTYYNPVYVLPTRWSNNPNELPQNENPDNSFEDPENYNQIEAKFHLSLKTKLIQSFLFGHGDIW